MQVSAVMTRQKVVWMREALLSRQMHSGGGALPAMCRAMC